MLIDVYGKPITKVGRDRQFQQQVGLISQSEMQAIEAELQKHLDTIPVRGSVAAGWVPGSDWTNTPYLPIYEVACRKNFSEAAKLFGKIFKQAVINHSGDWACVNQSTSRQKHGLGQVEVLLYWRRA